MNSKNIENLQNIEEGILSRVGDIAYALRFLKLLVTPWEKMNAFKYGLIDNKGKKLKKPELPIEKSVYTIFHRLVFNIKRLLNILSLIISNLSDNHLFPL